MVLERKPKIKPGDVFAKGGLPGNTTISFGAGSKLEQAKSLFETMSSRERQLFLRWVQERRAKLKKRDEGVVNKSQRKSVRRRGQ